MFTLEKDTYIIANVGGKNELAMVTSVTKSSINAYLDKDLQKDDHITPIKIPPENIVASLGKKPKFGSAYGVKVEPFHNQEELPMWGTLVFYKNVPLKERKWMYKAFERTIEAMDKKGVATFVPVRVEIREQSGKHLGYYKHSKKDETPSVLALQVPTFELEPEDIDYVIYHESGHGIWHKSVTSKYKALWTKLFERRIKCKSIKQKHLDSLLQTIYDYKGGTLKDLIKDELADDERDVVKSCLQYMNKIYRLSIDDIEILLAESDIDKYWPTQQEISSVFPDISEYSMKNTSELFSEAFAFYMLKHSLPKDVKELMRDTLDSIKN